MPGNLLILITKSTRDEGHYYAARAKEKKMHSAISEIEIKLENPEKNER